jgi:D-xylose transport system ATP-binding protein
MMEPAAAGPVASAGPSPAVSRAPLVEMRNIRVAFGGIHAVKDVTIDLYPGEVMGLVGGNGAGKSTLIRVLSGAHMADSGEVLINGKRAVIHNPRDAKAYGIETIYQTLALAENLDAPANMFLGREMTTRVGSLDDSAMESETRKVMARLNPRFRNFKTPVISLSGGQRQGVAIARAVHQGSAVLVMDEPMAALGLQEQARVSALIERLAERGLTQLIVSHNLDHVFQLSTHIAVMRLGRLAAVLRTADTDRSEVLHLVSGLDPHSREVVP